MGEGIQASADGAPLDVQLGRRGAEAENLGPESFYPIYNVVSNYEHREPLSLPPFLASHPRRGGINRGRKRPGHKSLVCATQLRTRSFCKRGIAMEHSPPDLIHLGGERMCSFIEWL